MDTQTLDFMRSVVGEGDGYLVYGSLSTEKSGMHHKIFRTAEELLEHTDGVRHLVNCYFSFSRFLHDNGPLGTRKQPNVLSSKSFVLDIDIGKEDCFISKKEAFAAVKEAVAEGKLLKPTWIVDSGGGLHMYWSLTDSLDPSTWKVFSRSFAKHIRQIDTRLGQDLSRTVDIAGVLRVPGTLNHKSSPATEVKILFKGCEYTFDDMSSSVPFDLVADIAEQFNKSKVVRSPLPKPALNKLLKACPQMQYYTKMQGRVSYGMWFSIMGLFPFLSDGVEEVINKTSLGNGDFSPEESLKKINSMGSTGPTLCETIQLNSDKPNLCLTCKAAWEGKCPAFKFKTPIQAASYFRDKMELIPNLPVPTTKADTPHNSSDSGSLAGTSLQVPSLLVHEEYTPPCPPPEGYFVDDETKSLCGPVAHHMGKKIVYSTEKLLNKALIPLSYSRNFDTDSHFLELAHVDYKNNRVVSKFTVNFGDLASIQTSTKILYDKAVIFNKNHAAAMHDYLISYMQKMENIDIPVKYLNSLGWYQTADGELRFALGEVSIRANDKPVRSQYTPNLTKLCDKYKIHAQGNIDQWAHHWRIYERNISHDPTQRGDFSSAKLLWYRNAGLSAVLQHFLPRQSRGCVLHLYSYGSGKGKSTLNGVIQSAFGKFYKNIVSAGDTYNAKVATMVQFSSLPVSYDELTLCDDEEIANFTYTITDGRGKTRMVRTDNGTYENDNTESTWETIVLTNGNISLREKITRVRADPEGMLYRLLDVQLDDNFDFTPEMQEEMNIAVNALEEDHYGLAGLVIAQYILDNQAYIRERIAVNMKEISKDFPSSAARYQVGLATCARVMSEILVELGLMDGSVMGTLDNICRLIIGRNHAETKLSVSRDYLQVFLDMLNQSRSTTVWVRMQHGKWLHVNRGDLSRDRVNVRVEEKLDTCTIYVSQAYLRDWCRENQISKDTMLRELSWNDPTRSTGVIHIENGLSDRVFLTKGTDLTSFRCICYMFKLPRSLAADSDSKPDEGKKDV